MPGVSPKIGSNVPTSPGRQDAFVVVEMLNAIPADFYVFQIFRQGPGTSYQVANLVHNGPSHGFALTQGPYSAKVTAMRNIFGSPKSYGTVETQFTVGTQVPGGGGGNGGNGGDGGGNELPKDPNPTVGTKNIASPVGAIQTAFAEISTPVKIAILAVVGFAVYKFTQK